MKFFLIFSVILSLLFQSACGPLKYKKVSAKDYPPDPRERVKKNMEEGRGFRIMGGNNKGNTYDFASSNPLWRATLDTLDFMPLVSANYSGGIVITDWYSEDKYPNESIKIDSFLSIEPISSHIFVGCSISFQVIGLLFLWTKILLCHSLSFFCGFDVAI